MALIVNGQRIKEEVIQAEAARMRPQYRKTFPDQSPEEQEAKLLEWARENIIEQVLLRQAAASDPRPLADADIDERLNQEKAQEGDPSLSPEEEQEFRREIELKLKVERLVDELCADLPEPAPEEARAWYEKNRDRFAVPELIRAAHIVKHFGPGIDPAVIKGTIEEVKQKLDSGDAFEELAFKYSDCPDNAGDLGYFPKGEMVPEFEEVVFGLKINQISQIFQTQFGFHIAKLIDKKPPGVRKFGEVEEAIKKDLTEESRRHKIEAYLDKLRAEAAVRVVSEKKMPRKRKKAGLGKGSPPKPRKSLQSILVKPSGPDCNMRCLYCFYLRKEELFAGVKTHRMKEEVLEAMIKQALETETRQVNFGWQGGEPTLMGRPFFEKAVAFQKQYGQGKTVGNGFQTNGLLINEEWADFFKRNSFLVGLSLDGPEHIHNHYRRLANGKGSWDRVKKSAELLLEKEVQVNALVVLNDYSVRYPEEIYHFHRKLGLDFMQFIPCVERDPADPSHFASFSVPPEDFGQALCTFYDLWRDGFSGGRPQTSIRFFDSLFHRYVGLQPPDCTLLEECGIYVVVEHNGDVYSCDFFVEPGWKLGRIPDGNLSAMLNSAHQSRFGKIKASLPPECLSCPWLHFCRGGCPKDRLDNDRGPGLSYLCSGYKIFFEHAHAGFLSLAEEWQKQQSAPPLPGEAGAHPAVDNPSVGRNQPCPCGSGRKFKKCCGR